MENNIYPSLEQLNYERELKGSRPLTLEDIHDIFNNAMVNYIKKFGRDGWDRRE